MNLAAILREHWLLHVDIDYGATGEMIAGTESVPRLSEVHEAVCICLLHLGKSQTQEQAVETWVKHVLELVADQPTCQQCQHKPHGPAGCSHVDPECALEPYCGCNAA